MDSIIHSRLRYGFLAALLIVAGVVGGAMYMMRSLASTHEWVEHTQNVRLHLAQVISQIKDIELSARGYTQTNDDDFKQSFDLGRTGLEAQLLLLRKLTTDNSLQHARIEELASIGEELIGRVAAHMDHPPIADLQNQGEMMSFLDRKALVDEARELTARLQAEEERLLQERLAASRRNTNIALAALGGGLFLDVLLVAGLARLLWSYFQARHAAEKAIRDTETQARNYAEGVVDTVFDPLLILTPDLRARSANRAFYRFFRTTPAETVGRPLDEIAGGQWKGTALLEVLSETKLDEATLTNREVAVELPLIGPKVLLVHVSRIANVAGEGESDVLVALPDISERKRALDELEAFSYSVSHDLRAPLRHIAGFAEMLTAHLQGRLDDKGQRYLTTITTSARHMGQLIDDLLMFSRIGRVEMTRQSVSLTALVREVIQSFDDETASRTIDWSVGELPDVPGDVSLLRQVFANLLGNAVKYTKRRAEARITIAPADEHARAGEAVVCVADNGAGFDMRYVDKLFGVFQRLHSAREFEGTGVGLANVRRIIQRHGGRVWAESHVDEGARFFVALPTEHLPSSVPLAL